MDEKKDNGDKINISSSDLYDKILSKTILKCVKNGMKIDEAIEQSKKYVNDYIYNKEVKKPKVKKEKVKKEKNEEELKQKKKEYLKQYYEKNKERMIKENIVNYHMKKGNLYCNVCSKNILETYYDNHLKSLIHQKRLINMV